MQSGDKGWTFDEPPPARHSTTNTHPFIVTLSGVKGLRASGSVELIMSGDRRVDVHAWQDDAFHGAREQGQLQLGVVRELLALTGDRVMCSYHPAAAALLAAGPTAPASPADAALWAGVAAADGLMRSGAADGRLVSAARGGYAVRSWGRRRGMVVSRVSRRGGGDGREVWVDGE